MPTNFRSIILLFALCILFSLKLSAQTIENNLSAGDTSNIASNNTEKLKLFDLHVGYGIVNGARIGMGIRPIRELRFELSTGYRLSPYIVPDEEEPVFSFGASYIFYNPYQNVHIMGSLLASFTHYRFEQRKTFELSPNIGFVHFAKSGILFFLRGGIYKLIHSYEYGSVHVGSSSHISFNIDLGLGFCFF